MLFVTIDNLGRKGFHLPNRCCMREIVAERVNHLLLHCEVSRGLWSLLLSIFRGSWVMPASIIQLLHCWEWGCRKKRVRKAWRLAPLCLMWCLWRERNRRTFEDLSLSIHGLKLALLRAFHFWFKGDLSFLTSVFIGDLHIGERVLLYIYPLFVLCRWVTSRWFYDFCFLLRIEKNKKLEIGFHSLFIPYFHLILLQMSTLFLCVLIFCEFHKTCYKVQT